MRLMVRARRQACARRNVTLSGAILAVVVRDPRVQGLWRLRHGLFDRALDNLRSGCGFDRGWQGPQRGQRLPGWAAAGADGGAYRSGLTRREARARARGAGDAAPLPRMCRTDPAGGREVSLLWRSNLVCGAPARVDRAASSSPLRQPRGYIPRDTPGRHHVGFGQVGHRHSGDVDARWARVFLASYSVNLGIPARIQRGTPSYRRRTRP